jgi:hypothetical protein
MVYREVAESCMLPVLLLSTSMTVPLRAPLPLGRGTPIIFSEALRPVGELREQTTAIGGRLPIIALLALYDVVFIGIQSGHPLVY